MQDVNVKEQTAENEITGHECEIARHYWTADLSFKKRLDYCTDFYIKCVTVIAKF